MNRGLREPDIKWLNEVRECSLCEEEYYVNIDTHTCDINKLHARLVTEFSKNYETEEEVLSFRQGLAIGFEYVKEYYNAYESKVCCPMG